MLNDVSNKGFQKHDDIVSFIFENVINQGQTSVSRIKVIEIYREY
jgi:hypothetical protein